MTGEINPLPEDVQERDALESLVPSLLGSFGLQTAEVTFLAEVSAAAA